MFNLMMSESNRFLGALKSLKESGIIELLNLIVIGCVSIWVAHKSLITGKKYPLLNIIKKDDSWLLINQGDGGIIKASITVEDIILKENNVVTERGSIREHQLSDITNKLYKKEGVFIGNIGINSTTNIDFILLGGDLESHKGLSIFSDRKKINAKRQEYMDAREKSEEDWDKLSTEEQQIATSQYRHHNSYDEEPNNERSYLNDILFIKMKIKGYVGSEYYSEILIYKK